MSATPAGSTPGEAGYIRGGGGIDVNTGRVVRLLAVVSSLALIALAVGTAVSTVNQNSRADKFGTQGVPVEVTVTGCTGISSGIAQAVQYYECRGTYTVNGRQYNEVIGGIRSQLPEGQTVHAIAAKGDPALVSTAGAAKRGSYTTPIILGVLAVVVMIGLLLWPRRRTTGAAG
jgi:hypothetical protein